MWGPYPKRDGAGVQSWFAGMRAGRRYEVVRAFTDFDGGEHPVGESWTFLGASFLPYDDGQSLFVSLDGEREWHIRMQWREEEQGAVLDHWDGYVRQAN